MTKNLVPGNGDWILSGISLPLWPRSGFAMCLMFSLILSASCPHNCPEIGRNRTFSIRTWLCFCKFSTMSSSSRDSCILEMGLEDLNDQTPIMMYTSSERQGQEISFLDALSTVVSTVAARVTHAGSSIYSTVQAAVTGVTSFLDHKEDELLPVRYSARFHPPVPPPISESLLSGPKQGRPPVLPVSRNQYEGHGRPWLDQLPRQEHWHQGANMEDRGLVDPHQQGINSYRRYHSNPHPCPFRHRWHMAPGHLSYQFPMPEQPYFSHFYGDDQRSPEAPGHLPYSTCVPSQQCPCSDVYGTTGVPGPLSHSLPSLNVEYPYQSFHGCPGVPGHLLTQVRVHGQQNPYSGPPESLAMSSPVADNLYASPTNPMARTPALCHHGQPGGGGGKRKLQTMTVRLAGKITMCNLN